YFPDWALDTMLFSPENPNSAGWLDPNDPDRGNAKNLLVRLLAETGVVGTSLFLLFFVRNIFFGAGGDRYLGAFRAAAATALCLNWLNSDTFADPAMWVVLALCHAACSIQESSSPAPPPRREIDGTRFETV